MSTTLSLEASKKVFELLGEYDTRLYWGDPSEKDARIKAAGRSMDGGIAMFGNPIPAPTFAELIRVLPKIGKRKGWVDLPMDLNPEEEDENLGVFASILAQKYLRTPSEPEGMVAVEEYLLTLI